MPESDPARYRLKPPEVQTSQLSVAAFLFVHPKATLITTYDCDVFGDGTVVIKSAAGHRSGYSGLYVKLAKTGDGILGADLYHYPEERTLNRVPSTDFNEAETRHSSEVLAAFLKQTGSQLWIQHDLVAHWKLKKAPADYD